MNLISNEKQYLAEATYPKKILNDIEDSMLKVKQLFVTYKKATDGMIYDYRIEPYSYKPELDCLYGWDIADRHIKCFKLKNIIKTNLLQRYFRPRWPIHPVSAGGRKGKKSSVYYDPKPKKEDADLREINILMEEVCLGLIEPE